jgi:hypothetical protein
MRNLPSVLVEELRKRHFVAYEDVLASFHALQDSRQLTLEQSYSIGNRLERLEAVDPV